MLKTLKRAALSSLKSSGVFGLVHNSKWRRDRLLILAYHGVSLADEHLWNGSQYMSVDTLRERFRLLQKSNCTVLPLAEAVQRLYANDLPDRAVAITFDDGTSDFGRRAFPVLKHFGFPATLYLTTFYTYYQQPVYDLMCSYLLWKGRDKTLSLKDFTGDNSIVDLAENDAREAVLSRIHAFTQAQKMSADDKASHAASLAARLDVDYSALLENRVLHNLSEHEVRQLANEGVDIQLHTHRHRTPHDRELFRREIDDNRRAIQQMTGRATSHFCYPSGRYDLEFLPWLKEAGIESATTCELGFASTDSNQLLLPRFLDSENLSSIEFESWLVGVSLAMPRRRLSVNAMAGGTA